MATAEQTAEAAAVLDSYTQMSKTVRATILQQVLAEWSALTSWRDKDIAEFVTRVVPKVLAGQDKMTALTGAYLNRITAIHSPGAKAVPVPTKKSVGAAVRNGTTPQEVYKRAGPTVWRALQAGDTIEQAVAKAENRLSQQVQTDMQLAKTHASQEVISKGVGIVGWRRELTGDKSCALCVVASTRTYRKSDLMPMHPGCDCQPVPVYGTEFRQSMDPESKDVLDAAHAEIVSRLGVDTNKAETLRKLTIVHDHGELGPLLAVRDQHFTGPSEIS